MSTNADRVQSTRAEELLELDVTGIAAGGDGVGRAEGMVVFIPRTAPGDRAVVRVRRGKRFARGELVELRREAPQRVAPPCAHYRVDRCGGCQLQHLAYSAQLDAKGGIIQDAIVRIGKRPVERPLVTASDREWRYRTKLTLAMRRSGDDWIIGLHPYDDPAAVFQLDDCPITDERVIATWREIMAARAHLPIADQLRASVRLVPQGSVIVMEGGTSWPARDDFFEGVASAIGLWWQEEGAARRLVAERAAAHAGASFAQINPEVAAALRGYVLERVRSHSPLTVVDAYSGVGDTAAALAGEGARVTAIEADVDAAARCAARLPRGSRAFAGRVEDLLPRALPADVVLVNPPRHGLHERITAQLSRGSRRPKAIVYVSCDPATFARDLSRLEPYRIASLRAFDMFPQTAHVETVCELVSEVA